MKERPILFSAPMVRAIIDGRKTQTRRIAKDPAIGEIVEAGGSPGYRLCPHGQPGDRLWVRETWAVSHAMDHLKPREVPHGASIVYYPATENTGGLMKRPSIFMPRWASRITLEVTAVRVERLQEISEEDAMREGIGPHRKNGWHWEQPPSGIAGTNHFGAKSGRAAFCALWEHINGRESLDANPWVWVVSFRLIERAA